MSSPTVFVAAAATYFPSGSTSRVTCRSRPGVTDVT